MTDPLTTTFENLDCWRHFPKYQFERRFDALLTPYLREVLESHVGVSVDALIVPEFPLKKADSFQSENVDYVLFAAGRRTVYLVELKTDCRSERDAQDAYLRRAAGTPWPELLRNVVEIAARSGSRAKYGHLLHHLSRAGHLETGLGACESAGGARAGRWRRPRVAASCAEWRVAPPFTFAPCRLRTIAPASPSPTSDA